MDFNWIKTLFKPKSKTEQEIITESVIDRMIAKDKADFEETLKKLQDLRIQREKIFGKNDA